MGKILFTACLLLIPGPVAIAASGAAKPIQQLKSEFVDLRFGMFLHFGIETFTGDYWSNPAPPAPERFTLAAVDCKNWADGAKSAGMKFGVLTAKHHYGFCLWNTATTTYGSMNYGLKKDIVREYVDAFRAAGLLPGLYFSILDAKQGISIGNGSADRTVWNAKKGVILAQLRELLSNYGDIPFLVLDGWAWQSGHNNIPMQEIRELVKSLQPNCLISDHNGLTDPWDEDILMFEEPKQVYAPVGNTYAAAQGQTINGHWFWGGADGVQTTAYIVDHLTKLQPRYTNFMLNCPPNPSGVLDPAFLARLADAGKSWSPLQRAPLPAQPPAIERPITPISAKDHMGASAWKAIDGFGDVSSGTAVLQSLWTGSGALPQSVTLDLGSVYPDLDILSYLPRQDQSSAGYNTTGNITGYRVYLSEDNAAFRQVAAGAWTADKTMKSAQWAPAAGRFVRLEATSVSGGAGAVIGELAVGSKSTGSATALSSPVSKEGELTQSTGRGSRRFISGKLYFGVDPASESPASLNDAAGRR